MSDYDRDWSERRANLRLGNAFERIGVQEPPLSVFELRAAVLRDEAWNPDEGDPHGPGWAAAYDRRGLLNLVAHLEARSVPQSEPPTFVGFDPGHPDGDRTVEIPSGAVPPSEPPRPESAAATEPRPDPALDVSEAISLVLDGEDYEGAPYCAMETLGSDGPEEYGCACEEWTDLSGITWGQHVAEKVAARLAGTASASEPTHD